VSTGALNRFSTAGDLRSCCGRTRRREIPWPRTPASPTGLRPSRSSLVLVDQLRPTGSRQVELRF
jgi:hypothetical protein